MELSLVQIPSVSKFKIHTAILRKKKFRLAML